MIRRGFVDVAEGQMHYRRAGSGGGVPLVMLHASPGSSKQLEALLGALAAQRTVYAIDTLGNGDSSRPAQSVPTIFDFADATVRALDALGLDRVDLYGTHTGASIAMEIAIAHPQRVRRLVFDGIGLYAPEEQREMLAVYAPEITPDLNGTQFNWAWHFCRDQFIFWPWFKRDREHVRATGLPPPRELHDMVLEVLKSIQSYHLSYRAAFRHPKRERLPLIRVPTLACCDPGDMLYPALDGVVALVPGCVRAEVGTGGDVSGIAATAKTIDAFLGAP